MPQNELPKLQAVFDAFLAEYPLCFAYWKKYADAEARSGQLEAARGILDFLGVAVAGKDA